MFRIYVVLFSLVFALISEGAGARWPSSKAQTHVMDEVALRLQRSLILVFDEECVSCAHLIKKMGQECKSPELQEALGVLAFGKKLKLRAKLRALKGVQTEVHPLNQTSSFFIEITPALWIAEHKTWKHGIKEISNYLWDKKNDLCHS